MTKSDRQSMSDEEMLEGCKARNEHAQKHLFNRYAGLMTGICMRYADRHEEAQDMVQDGFIKVFKKIGSFTGKGSLEGWIRKIMVNTALDHLRKRKKERFHVDVEEVEYKLKENQEIIAALQADDLLKLIHQLPTGYRTVFNLYAIEGYSHKEIAKQLGVSENTSKSQYSRARSLLQKKLEHLNIKR